jgi:hypothetical protein
MAELGSNETTYSICNLTTPVFGTILLTKARMASLSLLSKSFGGAQTENDRAPGLFE